jgi:hypothetical protein
MTATHTHSTEFMSTCPCCLCSCLCIIPAADTRYPNKQQQELFFRHYMAEDAAMQQHKQQQQQQQSQPAKRGPFAWLQRLRRHKHSRQQQQPSPSAAAPQQEQRQLHRLGSMEVPTGSSSSSSSSLPPLAPATLDELSASANVWALASHLYWGIWAIIQVRGVCRLVPCLAFIKSIRRGSRPATLDTPNGAGHKRNLVACCRLPWQRYFEVCLGCLLQLSVRCVFVLGAAAATPTLQCRPATAPSTLTTFSSTGHDWESTAGASRLSMQRPAGCLGDSSGPLAAAAAVHSSSSSQEAAAATAQRRARQRRSRRLVRGREQQCLHLCRLDSSDRRRVRA